MFSPSFKKFDIEYLKIGFIFKAKVSFDVIVHNF